MVAPRRPLQPAINGARGIIVGHVPASAEMIRVDFTKLRILVVDDNAHMRRIVRTLLHGFGSREVYEAEDGAAGLELFTSHLPDMVIVDWAMPVMDGIELTRAIRRPDSPVNPYVPIVMLTAHSEKGRVVEARDAGVTEFLCKPISAKALHQRLLNCVLNPRPFVRTRTYFGPDRRRGVAVAPAKGDRRVAVTDDLIVPPEPVRETAAF